MSAPSSSELESHHAQLAELKKTYAQNILFFIARSKNKNLVIYEGKVSGDGHSFDTAKAVDVYWLDLDPEYQAAKRKKGVTSDKEELNLVEKQFAYGVSTEASTTHKGGYSLKLVALPERIVSMFFDENKKLRAQMTINGKAADLTRVYVNAVDRTLRLPKVEWVDLTGKDPATGQTVHERIVPK